MAKFRSPFYSGEVFISQTYHSGSNNTAVDFGSRAVGTAVYAIANGVIQTVSPLYGSYLTLKVDNSDHTLFYVHIYNFTVKAGERVSVGQKIAEIAPQSVNGNVPPHLHLGLQTGKYLMDYMDRNIVFRTKYQAIKDIWFIGENLNWAKFQDLSYENTVMNFKIGDNIEFTGEQNVRAGAGDKFASLRSSVIGEGGSVKDGPRSSQNAQFNKGVNDNYTWYDIAFDNGSSGWVADVGKFRIYVKPTEPPVDPQPTECEKQITTLNNKIQALELTTETQEGQINSLLSQNKTLADNMNRLSTEKLELSDNLEKLQIMFDGLQGSYNILEKEKLDLQEELSRCKLELQEGKTNFIKKILDAIKKWLDSTVG